MNPDDYCQQKAAPPGSSVYYALRQAPLARQPLLTALFALRRELEETVKDISDPTVGRTKLAWWQKELGALAAGTPSHPVTQSLMTHGLGGDASERALHTLLAGFEMDLDQARYLDLPNLRRYLNGVGGTFAALVAQVSLAPRGSHIQRIDIDGPVWATQLGEALMLAQIATDLGDDARHGRIYIPIDEMQRFNVTAADVINRKYSDAFTQLMRFETTRAREEIEAALAAIPAGERRAQGTLRALAALALTLIDEIARDNFQVLHQRIALTPLRKLWVAWRAARRR